MADDPRSWRPGAEPDDKCGVCGGAATADNLCLAHLDEGALAIALDGLRTGELALDLRGVEIDNERWEQLARTLSPDGVHGPDLSAARLIQATFGEGVDLRGATFGDGADLSGATFGAGANLSGATFGDRAHLSWATFGAGANLSAATFGVRAHLRGTTFGDGADLSEATFGDRADLSSATFGEMADLRWVRFGEVADLRWVRFGEVADLRGMTFGARANLTGMAVGDGADLRGTMFGDGAHLREATFGDETDLSSATFGDETDLSGATFGVGASLQWATFGDRANLSSATFGDGADLRTATFGGLADLSVATFGAGTDLSGATFGERTDLRWATFGDETKLSGATFGEQADLANAWFVGDAALIAVVFGGQQRVLGPLYAGGTVDLYDAQFGAETRLEIDADGVVLSRVVFGGPLELRVLRARIEASETRFEDRATIAALDDARRPATKLEGHARTDHDGNVLRHAVVAPASVWSLRRTDVAQLGITGVRVTEARFAGAQGLEKLGLIDTRFEEHKGRQRVREETLLDQPDSRPTPDERRMGHPSCTSEQVAEIYRSLRKSREDAADAPGGNDLYVGEQRMRRRALREQASQTVATRTPRVLLALYEWIGGYGVRPGRPSLALIVLLAIAWPLAACPGLSQGSSSDALVFVMRSVLLLPNTHNMTTTTAGDAVQVGLRVVGPLLVALIVLGVRAQIKR